MFVRPTDIAGTTPNAIPVHSASSIVNTSVPGSSAR